MYDCKGGCMGPKAGLDVLEKIHFASVGSRTQDYQACSFVTVVIKKSDPKMAMNASDHPNMAMNASDQILSTIKQFGSQNQFGRHNF